MVLDCLKKASVSEHKSISFPAIGTGNLGFGKKEVAKIMTNAVAEFARQKTKKKLDVYFVVFPKDSETIEVMYAIMYHAFRCLSINLVFLYLLLIHFFIA